MFSTALRAGHFFTFLTSDKVLSEPHAFSDLRFRGFLCRDLASKVSGLCWPL
jgi:hypothetical protein